MPKRRSFLALVLAGASLVTGCGLKVPHPHELYEAKSNDTDFVNVIFTNVKCQLRNAAQSIAGSPGAENPRLVWLKTWGAKVDLKFTTDEMGSFNPGALFNPPPPFSLGIGLNSSTHATRIENVATTYILQDLINEGRATECPNETGVLIQSDLDIDGFLFKYANLATIPGTLSRKNPPFDTLTYEVTFVASYDASVTPTWTFTHVTVNGSDKFVTAQRSKTSNLIITFAKLNDPDATDKTTATLNVQGQLAHFGAVIGQAVASANKAVAR